MRARQTASILLLALFCCLQAANIAGYVLCRMESVASESVRDCGCDTYLAGAFTQTDAGQGVAKTHWKSILPDGLPIDPSSGPAGPGSSPARCHAAYLFHLPDPYADPAFHPPGMHA